jgi:hypothetical protein
VTRVILEVEFHEDKKPSWAEWEMWREYPTPIGLESEWITRGTAPSLESAIDHALNAWRANQPSPRDGGQPTEGKGA